jgi:hypothetical protein
LAAPEADSFTARVPSGGPGSSTSDGMALGRGKHGGSGSSRGAGSGFSNGAGHQATKARLLRAQSCADLFPFSAESEHGVVELAVKVSHTGYGSVEGVRASSPDGQGFEQAARACATRLRFAPAIDAGGEPMASLSVIRLRFDRLN